MFILEATIPHLNAKIP